MRVLNIFHFFTPRILSFADPGLMIISTPVYARTLRSSHI